MEENKNIAVVQETKSLINKEEFTPTDIQRQINLIQEVMRANMKDGEHFGLIPGCGSKPSLLKPGAEKLGLVFRLSPDYKIEKTEMQNGHREYSIVCNLIHIPTGRTVGQGVGSCSTMESKYRFRPGPVEDTGKPVPKDYWDMRKSNPAKAQEQIGGRGFSVRKVDGKWCIVTQGEKMENDNPADQYNTCLKMAKKRAHVDAILTATAASDIFSQDLEEIVENDQARGVVVEPAPAKPAPAKPVNVDVISESQLKDICGRFADAAKETPLVKGQYEDCLCDYAGAILDKKVISMKAITRSQAAQVLDIMVKEPKSINNMINAFIDRREESTVAA